jgi:hypothetical protein
LGRKEVGNTPQSVSSGSFGPIGDTPQANHERVLQHPLDLWTKFNKFKFGRRCCCLESFCKYRTAISLLLPAKCTHGYTKLHNLADGIRCLFGVNEHGRGQIQITKSCGRNQRGTRARRVTISVLTESIMALFKAI